ncbi:MAG: dTDP-4-dehydrorhamnose 3,5-epimerase [Bacteroidales bacterium]|nr:dTDP-4-dehydrorhamnose 3,5-epimerase [Bacteroidales bacterium]MDD4209223.1 dTDP-4-dehydrorhamnose 3,5-epimerase [Bacteroidales bacterium]
MNIISTTISNLFIIYPTIYEDKRGHFFESYNKQTFAYYGLIADFVQDNQSLSAKNVIRGLHFQRPPYAQTKLIRVISGAAMDVAVDIRKDSPSYGKYVNVLLTAAENTMFWIPEGFAHGFIALENDTILHYKTTNYYNKESEDALLWSDIHLNIDWGVSTPIISEKDACAASFKDFISPF